MKDLWDSVVRTLVPIVVGAVVGWFVTRGVELDESFEAALTVVVTGVLSSVYYVVARLLETYVSPRLGWLLGSRRQPSYSVGDGGE